MTGSNLFLNASAWVKAYTALNANISKFVLIQHILSTQVSDTGPVVLWLLFVIIFCTCIAIIYLKICVLMSVNDKSLLEFYAKPRKWP